MVNYINNLSVKSYDFAIQMHVFSFTLQLCIFEHVLYTSQAQELAKGDVFKPHMLHLKTRKPAT